VTPPAAAAPAVRARTAAPRPLVPPRRPRRISGPLRPSRPAPEVRPETRPRGRQRGLVVGVAELFGAIASHRLLDRLIRGRAWIVLVAFALIGIVTLQLALLKLNASIGRTLERSAVLQRENATLSIENSELAAGSRVEAAAERFGMTLVPAGSLKFLRSRGGADTAQAAGALNAPQAQQSAQSTTEAPSSGVGASASASGEASSGPSGSGESSASVSEAPASSEHAAAAAGSVPGAESTSPSAAHVETPSPSAAREPAATGTGESSTGEAGAGGGTQAGPNG